MSRVKIDIDDELNFDLEEGDMILHIKHNGDIGKVCMPDMNAKVKESKDSKDKAEKKVKAELEKQVGKKTADKAIDDEKKEGAKESMADRLNITETMEKLQQLATATNKR